MLRSLRPLRPLVVAGVLALALTSSESAPESARPWIGLGIEAGESGVRVTQVYPNTPGEQAGLKAGDEVVSLDGAGLKLPAELIARIQEKGVGSQVTLGLLRAGKALSVRLRLAPRPDELKLLEGHLLGKPAPVWPLGQGDLKGQVVVVEFWATWCGACRAALPRLRAWHEEFGKKGLRLVAVAAEAQDVVGAFAKKEALSYPVVADPDGKLSSAYRISAVPAWVVVDREGVVRYVGVGAGETLDAAQTAFSALLK